MHQLWRHNNGVWYVLYGPRLKRRISTRQKDRRRAEAFLAQFIAGAADPLLESPTVGEILVGYRDDRLPDVRGKDGMKYGVAALIDRLGILKPENLTRATIKRYAAERGAKPGTILREIGQLRAALAWAVESKWISTAPAIANPVRQPPRRERWLTKDEAGRLLAACTEPHIRLFVMLGLMTVARMGAILDLRWDQVDLERRQIAYGEGHGNKRRAVVPLNGEIFEALQAARRLSCSPFTVEYHGRAVKTVKKGFAAACRRAGIEGVTPHILRHSGATWMAMEGVPLSEIARFLGDTEAQVERTYIKFTPGYLARAADALQLG